jgi:DNA-binding response OmpR family regulator
MTHEVPAAQPLLLVEDDLTLAGLLSRHLRAHGHLVEETGSTEAAITALSDGLRPSLVLLDINLPGSSGWDLLRHSAYEDAGRPPVLVVSATAVSPDKLRQFGVAGFLPKPFPLETLVTTIERLVDHREEEEPG